MKRILCAIGLSLLLVACGGGGGGAGSSFTLPPTSPPSGVPLPVAPTVSAQHGVATVVLEAVIDTTTGYPAFEYDGKIGVAPTIVVRPGDTIVLDLHNELGGSGMQNDMNLHFHGLTVSPLRPADDVLTMLAMPGNTLHYVVPIPKTQEPGLYWYHPHIHGETNYQVGLSGMSGAIIVSGLQQHLPALRNFKEQILIVRDIANGPGQSARRRMKPADVDSNTHPCGADPADVHFTLNGVVRPTIAMRPGESQFFRVINATGHRHLVLAVDGAKLNVVAIDGFALDAFAGTPASMVVSQYVLPVAGRVEFVVTAPASGSSEFRTLCYNSGPAGDPDPPAILADLRPPHGASGAVRHVNAGATLATGTSLPRGPYSVPIPPPAAYRIVRLTEDSNGFYINGQAFNEASGPMFTVRTGTVENWTVLNLTEEVHDFHMHQVHFYVQSINGTAVAHPHWSDTVVVPPRIPGVNGTFRPGVIVALVDFRNPVIRGLFVFHCHILDHEDGGMMAKISAI